MPPTPSPDAPPKVAVPTLVTAPRPSPDRPPQTPPPEPVATASPAPVAAPAPPAPPQPSRRGWNLRKGAAAELAGHPALDPSGQPPTRTSSGSEPDEGPSFTRTPRQPVTQAQVAKLLARLVATVTGAFGWAAGRRGWVLREPDDHELGEMTEPVARILHRHVPLDWLNEDILDTVLASEAFVAYVKTEPLYRAADGYTDPAAAAVEDLTPGHQEQPR